MNNKQTPPAPVATKASDYKAIDLWGRQLGSFRYYIEGEQARALQMGAPIDALYERDGVWRCVSGLSAEHPFRANYATFCTKPIPPNNGL